MRKPCRRCGKIFESRGKSHLHCNKCFAETHNGDCKTKKHDWRKVYNAKRMKG